MVTIKLHCLVLSATSVAVQMTVVAPTAKFSPETREHTIDEPGTLSVVVAVYETTA